MTVERLFNIDFSVNSVLDYFMLFFMIIDLSIDFFRLFYNPHNFIILFIAIILLISLFIITINVIRDNNKYNLEIKTEIQKFNDIMNKIGNESDILKKNNENKERDNNKYNLEIKTEIQKFNDIMNKIGNESDILKDKNKEYSDSIIETNNNTKPDLDTKSDNEN
jgi:hypothetical protein